MLVAALPAFAQAPAQENADPQAPVASVPTPVLETENQADEVDAASDDAELSAWQRTQKQIDDAFATANGYLEPILFFDISAGAFQSPALDDAGQPVLDDDGKPTIKGPAVPLLVVILLFGGVFFTLRFGFINVRLFGHSLAVLRGKYDNPDDHGEVTHFQALTSALSATVGLGNIAGVALAISGGGPGAVFWMWFVAFFGMSAKFSSCTLAQMYRKISDESVHHKTREHVLGGPMLYLSQGMKDVFGKTVGTPLGKTLAILFAVFAIGGALGGGNMFQANQTAEIFSFVLLDGNKDYAWLFGVLMAVMVALVMVGGIRRIGEVTSRIVPAMCVFYCVVCLIILLSNASALPDLFASIFRGAFNLQSAGWGGLMGVLVIGVKRGAFSNEAGLGSAAIAHSAAKTDEPVREGIVAMIGPFIDTLVVCTMTALTILVTQDRLDPAQLQGLGSTLKGAALTAQAFGTLHGFMPVLLCIAVFVFAYSTMISWGYYGERATEYLLGKAGIWPFRIVFLAFIVIGPIVSLSNVLGFTDLLILSMAYPNILGMLFLSNKVAKAAKDYVRRLRSGEMKPTN